MPFYLHCFPIVRAAVRAARHVRPRARHFIPRPRHILPLATAGVVAKKSIAVGGFTCVMMNWGGGLPPVDGFIPPPYSTGPAYAESFIPPASFLGGSNDLFGSGGFDGGGFGPGGFPGGSSGYISNLPPIAFLPPVGGSVFPPEGQPGSPETPGGGVPGGGSNPNTPSGPETPSGPGIPGGPGGPGSGTPGGQNPPTPVPEPGTIALFLTGLSGLVAVRRKAFLSWIRGWKLSIPV